VGEREGEAARGETLRRGEAAAADSRGGGVREVLRPPPREGERESMAGAMLSISSVANGGWLGMRAVPNNAAKGSQVLLR